MELVLTRKHFTEKYTIGNLYTDQKLLCNTIEDRVRDLHDINHDGDFDEAGEGKIYGKTAIPEGRYKVINSFSNRLKRRLPILLAVPGFTGIRIHGGKNETWSEGCILVGQNEIKGGLINYGYWETTILNMIQVASDKKEKVFITIKS
jgi:hypothetical protein